MFFSVENGIIQWCERTSSAFCHEGFKVFFNNYILRDQEAILSKGLVGEGKAMLTDMTITYKIEEDLIGENPELLSCHNPDCPTCRASFSYSKPGPFLFLLSQILKLVYKRNKRLYLYNIKQALVILNGAKCQ